MVEGTVYLSSGQTVTLYAGDMLTANSSRLIVKVKARDFEEMEK